MVIKNKLFGDWGELNYPIIICSKFNYNIMKRKCENCGQFIYEFEDSGKIITFAHICNAPGNKILPSPEIGEKKKEDKYPDTGSAIPDIDLD